MTIFTLIYDQYLTRYSTRGQVTRPRSIKFSIRLWLDLGHGHLVFASTTNLESGPCFAKIFFLGGGWIAVSCQVARAAPPVKNKRRHRYLFIIYLLSIPSTIWTPLHESGKSLRFSGPLKSGHISAESWSMSKFEARRFSEFRTDDVASIESKWFSNPLKYFGTKLLKKYPYLVWTSKLSN